MEYVYYRCKTSKESDFVAIITSKESSDDDIEKICIENNIPIFRGDLNDVLQRYVDAVEFFNVDLVCRVSGDSPFVDVESIDKQFELLSKSDKEYSIVTNCLNGFVSEVTKADTLKRISKYDLTDADKEHVTKYIRDNIDNFKSIQVDINKKPKRFEHVTLTIDYPNDIELARELAEQLPKFDFTSDDVISQLGELI